MKIECSICSRKFDSREAYASHWQTHTSGDAGIPFRLVRTRVRFRTKAGELVSFKAVMVTRRKGRRS